MLLGKRPRPPLKRTTSMNDIMFDVNGEESAPSDPHNNNNNNNNNNNPLNSGQKPVTGVSGLDQRILATVSPRNGRRYSANCIETASFLRACGLCKRRLVPGRDIYMYRGDTAFCSLECRQQQINHDERKEKCSLVLKKEATASSTKSESVAAL